MSGVLVTGANGFVGRGLVPELVSRGEAVVAATRGPWAAPTGARHVLARSGDWSAAVVGCSQVVHLAARVHLMQDAATDPLEAYRQVNVRQSVALARAAAATGVRRFVFLSSIKVNGESTAPGRPFTEDDIPRPVDPYGVSKHEAELALREVERETGMEIVIIRPVLVYGPGVGANFRAMLRAVSRGVPLPLGAITANRRSLVSRANLVDFIRVSLRHPGAAGETFLVSDGEDLSTVELLRRTARALQVRPHLVSVPVGLLRFGAMITGKRATVERLTGSLQVSIAKAQARLGWRPPQSVDDGLQQAARGYREAGR